MTLDDLIIKLKGIDIKEAMVVAINNNTEQIEDKVTDQLNAGIRPDGSGIEPGYESSTIAYKRAENQPFDRVTLKDTGDFHKGIVVRGDEADLTIESTDIKTGMLEAKYGDVIGLTDDSINELNEGVFAPEISEELNKYFGI